MTGKQELPVGSFEAAELFRLRIALKSTYAQRLQDLQDMLDFNAAAESAGPSISISWQTTLLSPSALATNFGEKLARCCPCDAAEVRNHVCLVIVSSTHRDFGPA